MSKLVVTLVWPKTFGLREGPDVRLGHDLERRTGRRPGKEGNILGHELTIHRPGNQPGMHERNGQRTVASPRPLGGSPGTRRPDLPT